MQTKKTEWSKMIEKKYYNIITTTAQTTPANNRFNTKFHYKQFITSS